MSTLDRPLQEPPSVADSPWLPVGDPYKIGSDGQGGTVPLPGPMGKAVPAA